MILIDDADDARLACFRRNERGLTNRRQRRNDDGDGLFMAEGDLVVDRSLTAGCTAVIALVDVAKPPPVTAAAYSANGLPTTPSDCVPSCCWGDFKLAIPIGGKTSTFSATPPIGAVRSPLRDLRNI